MLKIAFFSDPHHLALSLFTDGVPLYKSSGVSIWPVYVVILNSPANVRMNASSMILCGIWNGPAKPSMSILLDPILKIMQTLLSVGVQMINTIGTLRVKVVIGIFDLPAKASVLCTKQLNGKYGCSVCLHPGKRLRNNSRVYVPDSSIQERNHQQVMSSLWDKRFEQCNFISQNSICSHIKDSWYKFGGLKCAA